MRSLLLAVIVAGLCCPCLLADEQPFDYFQNSWSVIGLKDYQRGTRMTPSNDLLLAGDRRVRVRFGRELTRLSREHVKTNLEGWLPVIIVQAQEDALQYRFTFWATPLPDVADWKAAYNWPKSGEDYLNWITCEATNTGSSPAQARVRFELVAGDQVFDELAEWTVPPGQSGLGGAIYNIPFEPTADRAKYRSEKAPIWLARTVEFWKSAVLGAAHISVPCTKSNEALLAAHVCQFIANDQGEVHGGEGFYDEFYIRDGAYQVMELEEAGLMDAARLAVAKYLERQRPDGRFESQAKQFDANGQALWVLWQYFKMTGDKAWLAGVYPQMRRATDWIAKSRKENPTNSAFAGLLPNGVADGEYLWDGKHHIVGYDLWNLRGLLCTADCAKALGKQDEAAAMAKEVQSYRKAINAACKATGLAYFPPSWEKQGTHWGNTETLWPTELFATDDPRVTALIHEVREYHGGGFREGTIRWLGMPDAIHPYMSAYTTMACLARGEDEQVVEDYYWYLLHSTATHAFPEGIFYKRRFAWSDTIPHVTGACNFAIMLRHMLVHERGDQLDLLLAVPDWWLADGEEIRVERAPTHFGMIDLRVHGEKDGVRVDLKRPAERPASRIVLHLPESRRLLNDIAGVEVVYRPNQKKRWDFPTVVKTYEQTAPPLARSIPDLIDLPLAHTLPTTGVKMLTVSKAANTDPFAAPFGVKNVGKLVFSKMPVGEQVVAGVPFDIIDPRENANRGLVVLHSPHVPADAHFPKEITIPVGQQGKRLFFLGNVSGWGTNDAGTGEWNAVAEYVIRYADGQTQTVPLIPGRTIEDWTAAPAAADVFCGMRGDGWHLNVLGVRLRPAVIESIVFRDLGTPAAPLLAAVSLEE